MTPAPQIRSDPFLGPLPALRVRAPHRGGRRPRTADCRGHQGPLCVWEVPAPGAGSELASVLSRSVSRAAGLQVPSWLVPFVPRNGYPGVSPAISPHLWAVSLSAQKCPWEGGHGLSLGDCVLHLRGASGGDTDSPLGTASLHLRGTGGGPDPGPAWLLSSCALHAEGTGHGCHLSSGPSTSLASSGKGSP